MKFPFKASVLGECCVSILFRRCLCSSHPFLVDPVTSSNFPKEYLERVRRIHSEGGYGSQGYKYDWKIEEAQKNILRTHTTAVSARLLYKLGQQVSLC